MNIGNRIAYFRKQNNITVNKLANLAGISQSYLRDLELSNKQPTVEYLSYICDALNISLAQFFSDEKSENELLDLFNMLTDEQKEAVIGLLKSMANGNKL